MTQECPDPFPAPTATESQTARERPQNRSGEEKVAATARQRKPVYPAIYTIIGSRRFPWTLQPTSSRSSLRANRDGTLGAALL